MPKSRTPKSRMPGRRPRRAKFEAAAKDLQVQSVKLAEDAEGGDIAAIGAQVQNMGKACGSCHKPFRAKK